MTEKSRLPPPLVFNEKESKLTEIIEIKDDNDDDNNDNHGDCDLMKISSSKRKHVSSQTKRGDNADHNANCVSG